MVDIPTAGRTVANAQIEHTHTDYVAERRGENAALLHPSLEASFQTAPQQQDGEPYVQFLCSTL